ncbi:MAG: desulfoferrodoxin [Acidimicrobiia bacterium]
MTLTAGSRVKCASCGAEAIVVKAAEPTLLCCGQPVEAIFTPDSPSASAG